MGAKFTWNGTANEVADRATGGAGTLLTMAHFWHGYYRDFVPMRRGYLEGLVDITATEEAGRITHTQVYAHYQYTGEKFNFSRDKHPLASAHWDQAAIAAGKAADLAKSTQAFIRDKTTRPSRKKSKRMGFFD